MLCSGVRGHFSEPEIRLADMIFVVPAPQNFNTPRKSWSVTCKPLTRTWLESMFWKETHFQWKSDTKSRWQKQKLMKIRSFWPLIKTHTHLCAFRYPSKVAYHRLIFQAALVSLPNLSLYPYPYLPTHAHAHTYTHKHILLLLSGCLKFCLFYNSVKLLWNESEDSHRCLATQCECVSLCKCVHVCLCGHMCTCVPECWTVRCGVRLLQLRLRQLTADDWWLVLNLKDKCQKAI